MVENFVRYEEGTVQEDGYGLIPQKIMRDKNLTAEAKAIYSYLCSFAGAGTTAFPSVDLMCKELNMSKNRYYRHFKRLRSTGLVKVEKQKDTKGKYLKNIYTLVQSPCLYFGDMDNAYMDNEDTISNRSKSNRVKNNNKRYMDLPVHDYISLYIYNQQFKDKFGKKHHQIPEGEVDRIVSEMQELCGEYDDEFFEAIVAYHFAGLPKGNDGDIRYFLTVKDRYLLEDME